MNFKQWLSNQSVKTFKIIKAATETNLTLQICVGASIEGEIDNLTEADLEALLNILRQRYENQAVAASGSVGVEGKP